jgi:prepilin-type N-terminal cleavage/methylation domain-containing protein
MTMIVNWRERRSDDCGFTLVETLVVMIVFSIILSIITSVIVTMLRQSNRESGQVNELDASRKVMSALDHSARYANAITTPGAGTTSGTWYVEFQTGNTGQQQTCTQWRYLPSGGQFQYRTWQPPLTGTATPTASVWHVEAIGISAVGSTPIFSIASTSTSNTKEELTVVFTSTSGVPSTSSASQITLTAINSTSASAPTGTSAVCNQVSRP